jgi:group I intron endonuclease
LGVIYKITNNINGKSYIGQTIRPLKRRWQEHCQNVERCKVLHRAIVKYGKENFTIKEIDTADTSNELNDKEIYWIKYYSTLIPDGYNMTKGGGGVCGLDMSKTEDWKRKIGNGNRGNIRPDLSEDNRRFKSKAVVQLSLDNEFIKIWESSRAIEKAGIGYHSLINRICNGDPRRHTAYGYKWKYYEREVG